MRKFTILALCLFAVASVVPCQAATHYTTLTWSAGTGGDTNPLIGYNVYRGTMAGGESGTPINATPVSVGCLTACTYQDNNVVAGQVYFYIVRATLNGVPSTASNEASSTIPFTLSTPANLSVVVH